MSRNPRRWFVLIAAGLLTVVLAQPAAAATTGARIVLRTLEFTGGTCDESGLVCTFTATGTLETNIAGDGPYDALLIVDFSLGGSCNEVDETDTFGFANGSLFVHSYHVDCREHGWR